MSLWLQRRTLVAYALSILTMAEIVDLTITSVAIPDLMGVLGANIEDISLTMTSYIVAAAVFIPLTGLMNNRYGIKKVALTSTTIFGFASMLCGTSTSLNQMIVYRLIQGIGGAFLPALAQSYVIQTFEPHEQAKVMGIVTICIVLGPIIGPVIGGYIVENMNWRWIFYVNVPVCLLGVILVAILMEETPIKNIKIDYISFIYMAIGISCLEYFVDKGNDNQWLESIKMISFLAIAIIFIGFFLYRGITKSSVVNFKVFTNSNFILSCLMMFLFMGTLAGGLAYFSSMLQNVYHYPVDTAGYLQAPRGVAAIIGAPIYLFLSRKIDARILMSFALALSGMVMIAMAHFSDVHNTQLILILVLLQGFGMIGVFVLLMTIAFIGVGEGLSSDSSGVFNFFRNFSNSIGTSIAATTLSTQQQVIWNDIAANISEHARGFSYYLHSIPAINKFALLNLVIPQIQQNVMLQSYLDLYYASGVILISIMWLPFFLAKPNPNAKPVMGH